MRIPEVQFEGRPSIHPSASPSEFRGTETVPSAENGQPNEPQSTPAPKARPHAPAGGASTPKAVANPAAQPPAIRAHQSQEPAGASAESKPQEAATPALATSVVPRANATDFNLDAAERHRVIEGAAANLTRYYVDPGVAQKMANALVVHEKRGDYDGTTQGKAFADLLTSQMREVSYDQHIVMVYNQVKTPQSPPAPSAEEIARYRQEMKQNNCTFETAEILPHNIGYLKFNSFPDASICRPVAEAEMAKLNHADAIIFDLRDNPGGYANMVALIATYLFDRPTHLNDFYDRGNNSTEESWTLPAVPGNRLADKPAFVLTSHSTFSAAEGFSYELKMLRRASLVGETTSGRGHVGAPYRIDDHFTIRIPSMKVINPISKTNWEGTGVEPDVKVNAADALVTAEKLAQARLAEKVNANARRSPLH